MKPLHEQRILVTGAAGLIGSALVWELNRRGCRQIVVCDLLGTSEKWRNLAPLRFQDYVEADALLSRWESRALADFDLVFHMGACSATTEKDASYLIRNNYEFTKEIARLSLQRQARFVYASSAATYGDGSRGMSDEAWQETPSLRPLNMYGYSKHLFDRFAWQEGWLERMVGLKFFNVFGPNEDHKGDMRSVVHKSFAQVQQEGVIRLFKSHRPDYRDGEQKRDFLYVKDAVAMAVHLATTPQANGLFNLGSGEAKTWIDLASAIFEALGKPLRLEFIEMPEVLREKYQYFTQADIGKLRSTGYSAAVTPLKEAVRDYVVHYLKTDHRLGEIEGH